ncbi:MAG TPA: tetratricopeptide repeat protein [Edaphocola sp.]|nr:tetratricopeptide repeat protein [Edaphocola sp.]
MMRNRFSLVLFFFLALIFATQLQAQDMQKAEKEALLLMSQKDFRKALPIWQSLYNNASFDKNYYNNYLKTLLELKSYDTAIALTDYMMKIKKEDLSILVDKAHVQELKGDKKQANKTLEEAIELINGYEGQLTGFTAALRFYNKPEFELKAYEAFQKKLGNPYAFAYEAALLYHQQGDTEKAFEILIDLLQVQPYALENTKQSLELILDQNAKYLKTAEKVLNKKLKQEPTNYTFRELFTWLQSKNGNKTDQIKEIEKLDEMQNQGGRLLYNLAVEHFQNQETETALQALTLILKRPIDNPVRPAAMQLYLRIQKDKIGKVFPVIPSQVTQLLQEYKNYFKDYPKNNDAAQVVDYADVLARYADQPQAAYDTLALLISSPYLNPQIAGYAKLSMGDYQVLLGNVWQAALLYSQVDKAFKEDRLGEEARFRNAKLAYYRGDFEFAQGQLSVLKAATTQFIANDALYLSVFITENTPEDKNFEVLKGFSKADLLLFQHKYQIADGLLDSLANAFPEDELQDDILMQRAKIAMKMQDYSKAVNYLTNIQEKYGDDVLADDATMQLADIYEHQFKDKTKAKAEYEKIILNFPGSSFVQEARTKYNALGGQGI